MNIIKINGKEYKTDKSSDFSIKNNNVYINGKVVIENDKKDILNIKIEGNFEGSIQNGNGNVEIIGDCKNCNISTINGSVNLNNLDGSIKTVSGSVYLNKNNGSIETINGEIFEGVK